MLPVFPGKVCSNTATYLFHFYCTSFALDAAFGPKLLQLSYHLLLFIVAKTGRNRTID